MSDFQRIISLSLYALCRAYVHAKYATLELRGYDSCIHVIRRLMRIARRLRLGIPAWIDLVICVTLFSSQVKAALPRRPSKEILLQYSIESLRPYHATSHATPHVPLEALPIRLEILRSHFVQRIARVRFEEKKLQTHNHRIKVKHRLPVLSQNVKTDIAFKIYVGMIYFLFAFHLGRVMWEILVYRKVKVEGAVFVHALVGSYRKHEIEEIVGVGKCGFHGAGEGELGKICHTYWSACG